MEKNNNWLVKAAIKSLVVGMAIAGISYFFFDSSGFIEFSSNLIINSIISGSIMTVILFIAFVYEEKKQSQE